MAKKTTKAYEIKGKLNFKTVTSKKGKVYKDYPHIDDQMLTTPYIKRFNELYGDLCLNDKIFRTMEQFGYLNGNIKRDESIHRNAADMPISTTATYDFDE